MCVGGVRRIVLFAAGCFSETEEGDRERRAGIDVLGVQSEAEAHDDCYRAEVQTAFGWAEGLCPIAQRYREATDGIDLDAPDPLTKGDKDVMLAVVEPLASAIEDAVAGMRSLGAPNVEQGPQS